MNVLVRWCRFNLVGAAGMVFQLALLAVLNRYAPGHYLRSTATAIEATLLHNFAWHAHYTWRDRRESITLIQQLFRFHAANGLVSMGGNLVLMRLLVRGTHLTVLAANAIAILVCSAINFWLGDHWAFAVKRDVQTA